MSDIDKLYEETKDYGRVQFVNRIAELENNWNELEEWLKAKINKIQEYGVSFGLTIDKDIAEYIDTKIELLKEILAKMEKNKRGEK